MRLIDADDLIELIKSHDDITLDKFSELAVIRLIKEQPTTYNLEKVVEEIIEASQGACHYCGCDLNSEDAIDIVKRGGVE